jgi:hypothetical protein
MLNMNLNKILRCNNNGLPPINAISLARVIAVPCLEKFKSGFFSNTKFLAWA